MWHFSTLISFYYRDGAFSSLMSFYYRDVTFFYLDIVLLPWCNIFYLHIIFLRYRDGTLSTLISFYCRDRTSCCDISFYPVAVMQHFLSWSKFIYMEATWVSMILSGNVQFLYFGAHEFNAFPVYFFIILIFNFFFYSGHWWAAQSNQVSC